MRTFLVVCIILQAVIAGTPAEWKQRTIYQVLTDRFSRSNGDNSPCDNLSTYCGGTFQGIIDHLDYITGMGFDAIWISPVVTNTPNGYHGYWAKDLYSINSHFGTSDDLKKLVQTCHSKGVWVMVDVVANHVGEVGYDYSGINPFNQSSYYHNCSPCPLSCNIENFNDQNQVELCRLAGLPDLNQTVPYVHDGLINWVQYLIKTYDFDGLRIDTIPEVSKTFWTDFQKAAGIYAVGEVDNGDINYVAPYQGPVDATLSYPLFWTLRHVFASKQSMNQLQTSVKQYAQQFKDPTILGTFSDNHDNTRFLHENSDIEIYKNVLTYVIMSQGIPIVYYGSEQEFNGGNDPQCREALWTTNYNTNAELYKFITTVVNARKTQKIQDQPQIQRYSDDSFYAFTRGQVFVALTNGGSGANKIERKITYHPYANGVTLCNVFYATDCVKVENGAFPVYLDHGESKIFIPK